MIKSLSLVLISVAFLLLIPLVAMQFTTEMNWSLFDFIVMGVLLFGTGLTYLLISRTSDSIAYRTAVGVAALAGFLLIWVNLAVGIIGSEDNPANLLYIGVLAMGFLGAWIARFQPSGMSRTLFAMALAQMLILVIAMINWKSTLHESTGIVRVFMLNTIFAALFVVSALLFRHAEQKQKAT